MGVGKNSDWLKEFVFPPSQAQLIRPSLKLKKRTKSANQPLRLAVNPIKNQRLDSCCPALWLLFLKEIDHVQ